MKEWRVEYNGHGGYRIALYVLGTCRLYGLWHRITEPAMLRDENRMYVAYSYFWENNSVGLVPDVVYEMREQ